MKRFISLILTLVLLAGAHTGWALSRPLPVLQPTSILGSLPASTSGPLAWPKYGQASVGAVGYGVLASRGEQKPVPTASVAKVMTALAVLEKKPLNSGAQGPTLVIGKQDVDFYHSYVAKQGSVVPVNFGERISQYQALQGLLISSGNNIATSLSVWAFGSEQAYTNYANDLAKRLGMTDTRIADASGYSPNTVSTASDLVKLGEKALQNPVIAEIVSQRTAHLPVAGTISSTNILLGQNNINGIKTGHTDQSGGVYLAAARHSILGHKVTIITAIVGAPVLRQAMTDSLPLLASTKNNFTKQTVIKKGQIVGYYNTPWGTSVQAIATNNVTAFGWKGAKPKLNLSLRPLQIPASAGHTVGTINSGGQKTQTSVTLKQSVTSPTWQWRLLHAF